MEIQSFWKAKQASILYMLLISGILLGSVLFAIILLSLGIDIYDSTFPSALISLPINEGIILIITIFFAKQNYAKQTLSSFIFYLKNIPPKASRGAPGKENTEKDIAQYIERRVWRAVTSARPHSLCCLKKWNRIPETVYQ